MSDAPGLADREVVAGQRDWQPEVAGCRVLAAARYPERGERNTMERRDEIRERFYQQVDELEATTEELVQGEPPLPPRAEATILDDLNEIRLTMAEADTSAGEYLADDDRTKARGYNHVPHRPGRPDIRRQVEEARRGERRRGTGEAS